MCRRGQKRHHNHKANDLTFEFSLSRTVSTGLDYRVRLDFAYIPKNAYESLTFFRIVERCGDWISPTSLYEELEGIGFWEKQEVFKTKKRPSSKSNRGRIEVIRDIVDLAAYIGVLQKRFPSEDSRSTEFKITREGKELCDWVRNNDPKAQTNLIARFMDYKIPNSEIDIQKYFAYRDFSVRPFFVLLRLLHDFEKDIWTKASRPRFHPKELGYIVLSVREESEAEFKVALDRMREFSNNGVLQSGNWSLLKRKLGEDKYTIREFDRKTNNLRTRLFRWPFVLGLIDCQTSIPEAENEDMFSKLRGIKRKKKLDAARVQEVLGLTRLGERVVAPILKTVYVYSGLTNSDKILSTALVQYAKDVDKRLLQKNAIKTRIYLKPPDFQYGIERLQSHQIVQSNGTVQVQLRPIFDIATDSERNEIRKKSNAVLQLLRPSKPPRLIPGEPEVTLQPLKPREVLALGKTPETRYILQGADPELRDYLRLSVGENTLRRNYSDIRMAFERKTDLIFRQMAFRTDLYGASSRRGESYPDIVAIWKRVTGGRDTSHFTIVECKSSDSPYNLSLKDIDDRIRQTRNLLNLDRYQDMKSLFDSVLFVSSSFGVGGNQQKMRELKEKYSQDLRMSVRIAAISARTLLELYVKYREEPSRFNEFNLLDLFQEEEISPTEIRGIFER